MGTKKTLDLQRDCLAAPRGPTATHYWYLFCGSVLRIIPHNYRVSRPYRTACKHAREECRGRGALTVLIAIAWTSREGSARSSPQQENRRACSQLALVRSLRPAPRPSSPRRELQPKPSQQACLLVAVPRAGSRRAWLCAPSTRARPGYLARHLARSCRRAARISDKHVFDFQCFMLAVRGGTNMSHEL